MTENEMVGCHHQLNLHDFEKAPGKGKGQGSLSCCSPHAHKESDMTEQLNSNNNDSQFSVLYFTLNCLMNWQLMI